MSNYFSDKPKFKRVPGMKQTPKEKKQKPDGNLVYHFVLIGATVIAIILRYFGVI